MHSKKHTNTWLRISRRYMHSSSKYELVRVGTSIKSARMLILVNTHGTVILLGHSRSSCGPTRKVCLLIPVAIERFYHCSVSKATTGHAVINHKELCVIKLKIPLFSVITIIHVYIEKYNLLKLVLALVYRA